jgi:type I restriction enzyme R subunit
MFDFVGVSDYHGDDDAMGEGGFVAEPRPKKSYQPRRLLVVDVEDHIDPMTRAWITVDEDGRLVFPQASEAKSAALGARFEAWLLTQTVNSEQARWLGRIRGRRCPPAISPLHRSRIWVVWATLSGCSGARRPSKPP